MSIKEKKENKKDIFNFHKYVINNYKKISWFKKSWK